MRILNLIALCPKDHLPIAQPLRTEHLVDVAQQNRTLLEHIVGQNVATGIGSVHAANFVQAIFTTADIIHKIIGSAKCL